MKRFDIRIYQRIFSILIITILLSCVTHKEIVDKKNIDVELDKMWNGYRFSRELNIYRFKENIYNINIGIFCENKSDYSTSENEKAAIRNVYTNLSNMLLSGNDNWESVEIDYFAADENEKVDRYKFYMGPDRYYKWGDIFLKTKYNDAFAELIKREYYYLKNSEAYSSQKNFEEYLKTSSLKVVERAKLDKIFGEQALSQSGVTEEQSEQLRLLNINFLIAFALTFHSKYVDSNPLQYYICEARLIHLKTSEVISTMSWEHYW